MSSKMDQHLSSDEHSSQIGLDILATSTVNPLFSIPVLEGIGLIIVFVLLVSICLFCYCCRRKPRVAKSAESVAQKQKKMEKNKQISVKNQKPASDRNTTKALKNGVSSAKKKQTTAAIKGKQIDKSDSQVKSKVTIPQYHYYNPKVTSFGPQSIVSIQTGGGGASTLQKRKLSSIMHKKSKMQQQQQSRSSEMSSTEMAKTGAFEASSSLLANLERSEVIRTPTALRLPRRVIKSPSPKIAKQAVGDESASKMTEAVTKLARQLKRERGLSKKKKPKQQRPDSTKSVLSKVSSRSGGSSKCQQPSSSRVEPGMVVEYSTLSKIDGSSVGASSVSINVEQESEKATSTLVPQVSSRAKSIISRNTSSNSKSRINKRGAHKKS